MTPQQEFIYLRTYSRWQDDLGRRETWDETISRYINFMREQLPTITDEEAATASSAIRSMHVMPSMRALWAAGPALAQNHLCGFNCAFLTVRRVKAFAEALYILMAGTGVGFSVERKYVDQLPEMEHDWNDSVVAITVDDSRVGWATALHDVLTAMYAGNRVRVDYSRVRPAGARLVTMGGRASGPAPLKDLFTYIEELFEKRRAKRQFRLIPINCHDIMNKIAEIVVVGGVRRSSEISLSDLEDAAMADAKLGEFWHTQPHRSMSNNSAVYEYKPSPIRFLQEWTTLIKSQSGERGVFNREGARKQLVSSGRRGDCSDIGTNPCGEILLRDMQLCNLSEVIVRSEDTLESLRKKVRVAVAFGAWQSTFTNFDFIDSQWKANCDEERLLGVSMTGIMDHPVLNNVSDKMKRWLSELKATAIAETRIWCDRLGINMSTAITTGKPSGTVSQLVDCASGIHPRYDKYYIRRYRISSNDPLFNLLCDSGVPFHPETGQDITTGSTMVFEFPYAAPKGAKTRHDISAIDQLEHWRVFKNFWCEHNQSITVYVTEDEWVEVGAWVYKNFDDLVGISFLPKSDHVYQLAPYEEIDYNTYRTLAAAFPKIDYSLLSKYELEDNTEGAKSYACVGDKCEI
jgi:ribonucleoside-diphosphate reductase alpha chain